jgi:hypothetical protein
VDEEFLADALDFIERKTKEKKPWFCYFNPTRMHVFDALDHFGVRRKISSFVMPMGYSFNLDGSMMYCTFASLFIAQAYGIELSLGTQILAPIWFVRL